MLGKNAFGESSRPSQMCFCNHTARSVHAKGVSYGFNLVDTRIRSATLNAPDIKKHLVRLLQTVPSESTGLDERQLAYMIFVDTGKVRKLDCVNRTSWRNDLRSKAQLKRTHAASPLTPFVILPENPFHLYRGLLRLLESGQALD